VSHLLDTNVCIRLINRSPGVIADRLRAHGPQDVRVSVITKAELFYGARHSKRVRENVRLVTSFCEPFQCLPFDDICAEHYGSIRADLVSRGENVPPMDLLIAATARAHDLILVTHNLRDFAPIVGLRLEDWEVE
jgi:tRNA(fMet)-specific endonuclease VapC